MIGHTFLLSTLIATLLISPVNFERSWGLNGSLSRYNNSTPCQGTTFPCDVNLSVTNVEYLGKKFDHDVVKVSWSFSSQSPCFAPVFQAGLNNQSPFVANFSVSVKLTRRFGHIDKGFGSLDRTSTGSFSIEVEVPRDTLETNPTLIDATVDMNGTLKTSAGVRVSGNGTPALNSGPQTGPTTPGNTAQCNPSVTITSLSYAQGSGTQKDTVTVNWTVAPPQSSCYKLQNVTATTNLKRADNSTGTGTTGGNGTATIQVSGSPGNVVSFDVTVFAQAGSSPSIKASAQKSVSP